MKAERRHELRENDLVRTLYKTRDWFDENGKTVSIAVLAVVVVIAAVSFFKRSQSAQINESWNARLNLTSPTDVVSAREHVRALGGIAASANDKSFLLDSLMDQAIIALDYAGQNGMEPDAELNRAAKEALQRMLQEFPDNAYAAGFAHNMLATVEANEFVLDGEPSHKDAARAHLEAVRDLKALAGTALQTQAIERLSRLDREFTAVTFVEVPREEPDDVAPAEAQTPGTEADPLDFAEDEGAAAAPNEDPELETSDESPPEPDSP